MTGRRPGLGLEKFGRPGLGLAKPSSVKPIPTRKLQMRKVK